MTGPRSGSAAPGTARRRLLVLAAVLLPVLAATGLALRPTHADVELPAAPAAAEQPAADAPLPAEQVLRLTSGGRDRAVLVQDPPQGRRARALVVVLGPHGLTAAQAAAALRLPALAARDWAVAYPSALGGDWDAGRCCGTSAAQGVDDVAFLQDVRELLEQRYGLAGDRVGLVGYSTGGQMAYRLVCEHPTYARAVVVVAGSLETSCTPSGTLPATLVVHGLEDTTVPYAFTTHRTGLLDYAPRPALSSIYAYASAAGCDDPVSDRSDGRDLRAWTVCDGAPRIDSVGMPGTGHVWEQLGASVYASRFLPPWVEGGSPSA